MKMSTKKMVTLALISAIAFVMMLYGRVPVVLFLKYDPKDIMIAIGGLIYGPISALAVSIVVSLLELTVSDTGFIGFIMNALSSAVFACTAAIVYKKFKTMGGAVAGLTLACLLTTAIMLLWNYLITPLYMNATRAQIAAMLVPTFLPFNLMKWGLNAVFTLVLYKPLVRVLRRARMLEPAANEGTPGRHIAIWLGAALVGITCILYALVARGVL